MATLTRSKVTTRTWTKVSCCILQLAPLFLAGHCVCDCWESCPVDWRMKKLLLSSLSSSLSSEPFSPLQSSERSQLKHSPRLLFSSRLRVKTATTKFTTTSITRRTTTTSLSLSLSISLLPFASFSFSSSFYSICSASFATAFECIAFATAIGIGIGYTF